MVLGPLQLRGCPDILIAPGGNSSAVITLNVATNSGATYAYMPMTLYQTIFKVPFAYEYIFDTTHFTYSLWTGGTSLVTGTFTGSITPNTAGNYNFGHNIQITLDCGGAISGGTAYAGPP